MQSDGWILSIPDFRPKKSLIVTASVWASLAAGDRVVLLDTVTVLIKPYLQAIYDCDCGAARSFDTEVPRLSR